MVPISANNSMKHQSFVHRLLNDQTVLFLTIQFNIRHFFAHSLNVKHLYFTHYLVLELQVRMDMEAMTMKRYSTFPKTPGIEPHHQIILCSIRMLIGMGYSSAEMQSVYSTVSALF